MPTEAIKADTEAWMRGPIEGVNPLVAPVLFTFQQTREELQLHTAGLSTEQVWSRPYGLAPVGFHLRHIAGSIDRLATYLQGRQLSAPQVDTLKSEMDPGARLSDLLAVIEHVTQRVGDAVRGLDVTTLSQWRGVGRKQLPTTVIGLLVHIAEHTQRHLGQAIVTAQLVRKTSP